MGYLLDNHTFNITNVKLKVYLEHPVGGNLLLLQLPLVQSKQVFLSSDEERLKWMNHP